MIKIEKNCISNFEKNINDKVSIIITNYKKEKFLKKAVASCLMQSHSNIEIIVVDDGSKSNHCSSILKSIKSNKIRYIKSSKNYGHYVCCNYAMDIATGKYITFLGADDTLSSNHLKDLLVCIDKYNLVAALSLYTRYSFKEKKNIKKNKLCEASILFNKDIFLKKVGYFHPIRYAADTEYRERASLICGDHSIGLLNSSSYRALYVSDCLTANKKTKSGLLSRNMYVKFFRKMHLTKTCNDLYFDYKNHQFLFSGCKKISTPKLDLEQFREIKI